MATRTFPVVVNKSVEDGRDDPNRGQHPYGSHRQGTVGSSPDGRGQTLAICQGKNSLTY